MLKGLFGILLFVFFLIVFFLILLGGRIINAIKKIRQAYQHAADQQEQRYRTETGRQRQQYSHRRQTTTQQAAQGQQQSRQSQQTQQNTQQEKPRHTQTTTGETIIDHRHAERSTKKIFDDSDGEYVEFEEA